MQRRTFLALAVPAALSCAAVAQEMKAKRDRLSGWVRVLDADKKEIDIEMSSAKVRRKIMYDDSTKFTMNKKPADASALKEGERIVAIGTFDGVNLKATNIALTEK